MSTNVTIGRTYVGGQKIAYLEQCIGSPVNLIHGIPTNSRMWRAIIPQLAAAHRVIAPDLLNYGQSEKPLSADVAAHDIGGGVAQLLAVNNPEAVRKLVLINSVCFDSGPISEFELLQHPEAESKMSLKAFITMMRGYMPTGEMIPHTTELQNGANGS